MTENSDSNRSLLTLSELIGQEPVKQRLGLIAKAFASGNSDAMPGHILFEGPDGSGRLAFAHAFASSIHANFQVLDPRSLETLGDYLSAYLTEILKGRTVVCVEGTESLKASGLARLTEALQDGKLRITSGQGAAARDHTWLLHPFTAILLTSRSNRMPEGIHNAVTFKFNFQRYSSSELDEICLLHARRLGLTLDKGELENIGQNSSGMVGNVIKTLRDVSSFIAASDSSANVEHALEAFGVLRHTKGNSNDLQELSGIEFEHRICGLLDSMGFQTETTRASGDGGIDIVAILNQPVIGGRYLFQCKRFAAGNVVGAPHLRDFFGALRSDPTAVKGVFVTTSSFTEQARQFAQQVGIELIDSTILSELFTQHKS